jgi:anthranilate phosphoribosyltransferase
MTVTEQELKSFGSVITLLMAGNHLSQESAEAVFSEILFGNQPDLHKGALLTALRMKGETVDEIAGCFNAIYQRDTNKVTINAADLVENCGTGMDTLKTFNISTLSAIVAASLGVNLARHGARALSSRCGTVDLCEALGVDVDCDVEIVSRAIEKCGIGLFNGMSLKVHPGGLGRILSQIRFGTTLNIAASLANPALPAIGVRGVGSPELIEPTLKIMKRIGYRKAVVYFGRGTDGTQGMDELSTFGASRIGALEKDGGEAYFELNFRDLGLAPGNYEEIRPRESIQEEVAEAVRTLSGKGNRSRTDIVALNTGVILWAAGKSETLPDAVQMAGRQIRSGRPLIKLVEWIKHQNRDPQKAAISIAEITQKAGSGPVGMA